MPTAAVLSDPRAVPPLRSVLLVDDDEALREGMAAYLRAGSYEVQTAASCDEGLERARSVHADLAVVDLRLPRQGGMWLLRALREELPDLRVCILTGYGAVATAVDAMRLGAIDYLQKPALPEDLVRAYQGAARGPLERGPEADWKLPSLARLEWEHINRALAEHGGNITRAAAALHMHRQSLQRKLRKYPPRE